MSGGGLTLISPVECKVFQRKSRYSGTVLISGRVNKGCETLEYSITGKPLKGALSGRWRKIDADPATACFNHRAEVPAGGWYRFDLRALSSGRVVCERTVSKFGVGEVFVGAGQSNSTNYGESPSKQTSGMVSCFSGEKWEIRDDPFPGSHDYAPSAISGGGSYYPAFGDALYRKYRVPIGIASTGQGGSSVSEWNTEGGLLKWMICRVGQLGPGGFRAVLWHQGEADNDMPPDTYYKNMVRLVEDSNRLAGWSFPWFVANATYTTPRREPIPGERAAQKRLWDTGVALEGPDTDALLGDMRDYDGTGVHLSVKGLAAHGKMWAEKVSKYLDSVLEKE